MEHAREHVELVQPHGWIRSGHDLLIAALLGLTVIAIAWGAYRAEVGTKDGEHYYNRSDETRAKANRHELQGDQVVAADGQLFLALERDRAEGNTKAAALLRKRYLTPEFLAAVRWWEQQPAGRRPSSPFVVRNPAYHNAHYDRAAALEALASRYLDRAHRAEEHAIDYTIVTVILTCGLFLVGISTQIVNRPIHYSLIAIGTLVLLGSVGRFVDLGV